MTWRHESQIEADSGEQGIIDGVKFFADGNLDADKNFRVEGPISEAVQVGVVTSWWSVCCPRLVLLHSLTPCS